MKIISGLAGIALALALALALGLTGLANAGPVVTVDFENNPALPAQPNNFAAAGAMQTYSTPGLYSIAGGVVLGNPTFLASFPAQGSGPNLYGTTDIAHSSLLDTLTLNLSPSQNVTNVNGKLFNGQTFSEDYVVRFFGAMGLLGFMNFSAMTDNSTATGFGNFAFTSSLVNPITSVTFSSPNSAIDGWDFFVDSINFMTNPGGPNPVPEPSSLALVPVGLLVICYSRRKASVKAR